MSLIHKALKKVEKRTSSDYESIVTPEEEILAKEKSGLLSTSMTPRTMVLIALVVVAAAIAVYMNFFAGDDRGKVKVQKPVEVASATLPEVSPAAEPRPDVAGVSIREGGSAASELTPEVKILSDEGEKYFLAGDFDKALAKFKEALTKAPDSPEILNSMGLVLKKKGDFEAAERYYDQALKYDPDCCECLNNLAVLKADQGDNVSAVLNLRKAVAIAETYADPYFNLAVIMEKEGNFKSAVEYYKKFLMYTSSDDKFKNEVRMRIEDLALNWEE